MRPAREGESSKDAEKRFKRQQDGAIAVTLQQGDVGIRISSGDSISVPHVSPNRGADDAPQFKKKKTRGPSKLRIDPEGTIERIQIEWNELGQPVGHMSAKFSTQIGVIARGLVPVILENWSHISQQLEDDLWICVQEVYAIDDGKGMAKLQIKISR